MRRRASRHQAEQEQEQKQVDSGAAQSTPEDQDQEQSDLDAQVCCVLGQIDEALEQAQEDEVQRATREMDEARARWYRAESDSDDEAQAEQDIDVLRVKYAHLVESGQLDGYGLCIC